MSKLKDLSITKKILLNLCAFMLLLSVSLGAYLGVRMNSLQAENTENSAKLVAETAADFLDGDRVLPYLESLEKDDYYEMFQKYIDNVKYHDSKVKYIYVLVPGEDETRYVWDENLDGKGCPLGSTYVFETNEAGVFADLMAGKEVAYHGYTPADLATGIISFFAPVYDSQEKPVAVVGVDVEAENIASIRLTLVLNIILLTLFITLCLMVIVFFFFQGILVKPINRINQAAKSMVSHLESDNYVDIEINSRDEIGELAESFNQMYRQVKSHIAVSNQLTADKERIRSELSIASQIQADMLPSVFPALPNVPEADVYATMDPAKEVGGDFYDFFMVDDTHVAIVVGDVSGKGVPAALFMVIGKTLIKDRNQPGKNPGNVFEEVNRLLCESNEQFMFITAFEAVLDLETGEVLFVNAGHEHPFLMETREDTVICRELTPKPGLPLALMKKQIYEFGSFTMKPGERLFQYTDGVTEATNSDGKLYGIGRLRAFLSSHSDLPSNELLPALREDIDRFAGDAPQFDDITMLCLTYVKPKQKAES